MKRILALTSALAILAAAFNSSAWGRGGGGFRGGGGGGFRGGGGGFGGGGGGFRGGGAFGGGGGGYRGGGGFGGGGGGNFNRGGGGGNFNRGGEGNFNRGGWNDFGHASSLSRPSNFNQGNLNRQNINGNRGNFSNNNINRGNFSGNNTNFNRNNFNQTNVNNHWNQWHNNSNHPWYNGHWHGNWDNHWHNNWNNWGNHPWYNGGAALAGVTGWWLGSSIYNSGYYPYYNPYYVAGGSYPVDYSQPFQSVDYYDASQAQADSSPPPNSVPVSQDAISISDSARQSFYDQNYEQALSQISQAIAKMPGDAGFSEFQALVFFAMGRYQPAASMLNSLLAVSPGWDWTTMVSLYPNVDVYTKQLRALEAYCREHPSEADARFLLAYQYMTDGSTDAAADELKQVVELAPRDRVASQLLSTISKPGDENAPGAEPSATAQSPEKEAAPAKPMTAADLAGSWTSRRDDGSTIQLQLANDTKFTWTYTAAGKSHEMKGTSTVANNLLILQQSDGNSMIGRVQPAGNGGFRFVLMGAPPDDPGLTFTR